MEEPYGEGVANHAGPESCVGGRKAVGEALTGARAGRVLSRENPVTPERRRCPCMRKATSAASLSQDARRAPRGRQTPSTHGNTSHETREVPRSASG